MRTLRKASVPLIHIHTPGFGPRPIAATFSPLRPLSAETARQTPHDILAEKLAEQVVRQRHGPAGCNVHDHPPQQAGTEHAGLVCTFPTYRLRSTVREVGRALELPMGDLEKLSKLAGHRSARALREEFETLPEFRDRKDSRLWQSLLDLSE